MKRLNILLNTFGVAGYEDRLTDYIYDHAQSLADEIQKDCMGNIIALKKGNNSQHKLMLITSIDQTGFIGMVKDGDVLRFGEIGTHKASQLVGQAVEFENGATGIIGSDCDNEIKIKNLYVDVIDGEAGTGDVFALAHTQIKNDKYISSSRLSSRVGAFILLKLLAEINANKNDIYFVFATQGGLNFRGSRTATFSVNPDMAITIGTAMACDTPSSASSDITLAGGPAIKIKDKSILAHPQIKNSLMDSGDRQNMDYQLEVTSEESSEGGIVHISSGVVMTGGVSVPLRYKDSHQELCLIENIEKTASLIKGCDLI
ncbi:MAG: hypothetical protein PHE51_10955 [Eubacteriales bacterium]|nr:hypothetical protein [Eubacteriales bacterium]